MQHFRTFSQIPSKSCCSSHSSSWVQIRHHSTESTNPFSRYANKTREKMGLVKHILHQPDSVQLKSVISAQKERLESHPLWSQLANGIKNTWNNWRSRGSFKSASEPEIYEIPGKFIPISKSEIFSCLVKALRSPLGSTERTLISSACKIDPEEQLQHVLNAQSLRGPVDFSYDFFGSPVTPMQSHQGHQSSYNVTQRPQLRKFANLLSSIFTMDFLIQKQVVKNYYQHFDPDRITFSPINSDQEMHHHQNDVYDMIHQSSPSFSSSSPTDINKINNDNNSKYENLASHHGGSGEARLNHSSENNEFTVAGDLCVNEIARLAKMANYVELTPEQVHDVLHASMVSQGTAVQVDKDAFQLVRIWYRGKVVVSELKRYYPEVYAWKDFTTIRYSKLFRKERISTTKYRRVIIAVQLNSMKNHTSSYSSSSSHSIKASICTTTATSKSTSSSLDQNLYLKTFKDVPIDQVRLLLPKLTLKMTEETKFFLGSTFALGSIGLVFRTIKQAPIYYVVPGLAGYFAFQAWQMYVNRRNSYMVQIMQALYYQNVASNRGVLSLLLDRAEGEEFKEALIASFFIFSESMTKENPVFRNSLKSAVEAWIKYRFGVGMEFDVDDAIAKLQRCNLLFQDKNGQLRHRNLQDSITRLLSIHKSYTEKTLINSILLDGFTEDIEEERLG